MQTHQYYNKYATEFVNSTFNVDMERLYQPFLANICDGGVILDLGCGSGRDSLAFKNKGYKIEAIDYSEELVKQARDLTGIAVSYESFYDFEKYNKYDGIWACASLLHCEREKLADVVQRISNALKENGILYMSFKYGDQDREKDGRNFTDLNEQQAEELLHKFEELDLIHQWITLDQRPERKEKWLNLLVKKT